MTDPTPEELSRIATQVARAAARMTQSVIATANLAHVQSAIEAFYKALSSDEGHNADSVLALAIIASGHAKSITDDIGGSYSHNVSIVAATLGMLADHCAPITLPTDPKDIH